MKKFITATALAAFAIASTSAMAQDTKQTRPNLKTPTEQQMDTQSTDDTNSMNNTMNKTDMEKPATTGAASSTEEQSGSKVPGKPTDTIKDSAK
jgi:hypothetical protein